MVKGIGTDIIEINRIKENIEKHSDHFLDRIFTKKEQEYCAKFSDSTERFAGRFAAKEAIAKALGCGFGKELSFVDIEISNDSLGKPLVQLSEKASKSFNDPKIEISISHCKDYAVAMAASY